MERKSKINFWTIVIALIIIRVGLSFINGFVDAITGLYVEKDDDSYVYDEKAFNLITTPDNKILEDKLLKYAKKKNFTINIVYADNLDIVDKINSGEKYDAIWSSNSIWLDMLDKNIVSTSNLKSTSITPIMFGIKESKAKELGLKDKKVTMNDLLSLIKSGKLTFSMANPITTNSGASGYLNILSTLAGNKEVLTSNELKDENLKKNLRDFFTGVKRISGDEDFLEESFINGDYDAAFTYESSIININKKLEEQKKEILYAIYPIDGVSISDSPIVYINNKNDAKKEVFLDLQAYLLSNEGQEILLNLGRRTWYGGINNNAPSEIFNKKWGINTSQYISPIKYPSKDVIKEALMLYQEELRKPVHVVFCLDYSGSMYGNGIEELQEAMSYIFSEQAKSNLIQFTKKDKIDVIAFEQNVNEPWTSNGGDLNYLLNEINSYPVGGTTALYPAATKAIELLKDESDDYNVSVILMTDGEGNVGDFNTLSKTYKALKKEIPIYSITFGDALEEQLDKMAKLSNGKVFDGRSSLIEAFKTVRGYN